MYSGTTLFVAITNFQITCCRLSSAHKIGSAGIAGAESRFSLAGGAPRKRRHPRPGRIDDPTVGEMEKNRLVPAGSDQNQRCSENPKG